LEKDEKSLIKKILSLDPRDYGKIAPFYGIKPVPKGIIAFRGQRYFSAKHKDFKKIRTQFLPAPAAAAFKKMKAAMKKELHFLINVASGYRSPAWQAAILFIVLFENKWNLQKTMKRLTLPGCSEHGYPFLQAVDVAPERGIEDLQDFDKTEEYKWLLENAGRFGFSLSYPKGNKYGVMFEPWHWSFRKQENKAKISAWSEQTYKKALSLQ
jgi:D-alanyl-D-alanine carboxypeptidase